MGEVRQFPSEHHAARYWLENRTVRRRSPSDLERRAGCPQSDGDTEGRVLRSLVPYDAEATLVAIERALEGIAEEWCGVVLVCVGWGALVGVPDSHERSIRTGPWMARADLPARWNRLPGVGLTRRALWTRREQFRAALAREGVLDREEVEAWARVERGEYGGDEMGARWLVGWKAIAEYLGCCERTAREYRERGMPVIQVGRMVRAMPESIDRWLEEQVPGIAAG